MVFFAESISGFFYEGDLKAFLAVRRHELRSLVISAELDH